jgi:PBSX family phage portal protein
MSNTESAKNIRLSTGKPRVIGLTSSLLENRKKPDSTNLLKLWSKALPDPFASDYRVTDSDLQIISPPVNPNALLRVVVENSFLQQCIKAMVTNTVGFGYTFTFKGDSKDNLKQNSVEAQTELETLEELINNPNPFQTYADMIDRFYEDKFTFANAYLEIIRDNLGRVVSITHLPAPTMRICKVDKVAVDYIFRTKRGGKPFNQKIKKHFRRYVQIKSDGYTKVFFKEYGDTRIIDPSNGKENAFIRPEEGATEVLHVGDYNASSIYGLPNWYAQLPSIVGSRQAELTNLDFFENNAIPAMAILVAGGLLTEETMELIEQNFSSIKGRGSMNKVAVIEASPNLDAASASGATPTPTIKLEPLYADRQQDATFLNYTQDCQQKIMSSFRLPPVYIAGGKDYTFASAKMSTEVAETQVFIPERRTFDDFINKYILSSWEPKYWVYKTNNSTIATSEDMIKAVTAFTAAGGITPNIARELLNKTLNVSIPEINELYGNIPANLLEAILKASGGEDKTNLIINSIKTLAVETIDQLEPIKVQTPGDADAIIDPINDPGDAPKKNNQGRRNDLRA